MPVITQCKACGFVSIYVYKCSKCGETRCFSPSCTGDKSKKNKGGALSDNSCFECKKGKYKQITI